MFYLSTISKILYDKGIILYYDYFVEFAKEQGNSSKYKFGVFYLNADMSYSELDKKLQENAEPEGTIKVTIPEGFNVLDISNTFVSKLPNFNKDQFLLEAIKKEGYLFPDTYFFFITDNEKDVLKSMGDNFGKRIMPVRSQIELSGKTEKDIIIMASIIERESKGDNDREVISGILWRRLVIGMPLQVDTDPSTYKTKGLPKNPICNPGMEAINAAIHPKISNYLYYLHDKDGNIHYAKTFAEHVLNKKKYLK